ncbi:choice-of-anchor A family protein [Xylanimonas allomyrinae]|uniref:Choice-of-anchor A family protein n=1 Tax=Xylanimonas allomyrinae TaxID=2509459 RepID=A0A4V0YE04_9MICO|nr:choice-of-anchor A family protein [Xylanimonas allomyrinae]
MGAHQRNRHGTMRPGISLGSGRRGNGSPAVVAIVAAAVVALVATGSPSAVASPPAPHTAGATDTGPATPGCPEIDSMPGLGTAQPRYRDPNVAVFVGGNWTVGGAKAEVEGQHVVLGDATFAREAANTKHFGIGVVGGGSGIVPPENDVILAVGGNVVMKTADQTISVGDREIGGRARIGGTVLPKATPFAAGMGTIAKVTASNGSRLITPYGGTVQTRLRAAAVEPWSGMLEAITTLSEDLAALAPTGSVSQGDWSKQGELRGDGTSVPQVFDVSAADLDRWEAFAFTNIPGDLANGFAPVVINVLGRSATLRHVAAVTINGAVMDNANVGAGASALMWNFPEARALAIAGAVSQTVGSILAPHADVTSDVSTNGRLYVGGDLTQNPGVGHEHHNYPWTGADETSCGPRTGRPRIPNRPSACGRWSWATGPGSSTAACRSPSRTRSTTAIRSRSSSPPTANRNPSASRVWHPATRSPSPRSSRRSTVCGGRSRRSRSPEPRCPGRAHRRGHRGRRHHADEHGHGRPERLRRPERLGRSGHDCLLQHREEARGSGGRPAGACHLRGLLHGQPRHASLPRRPARRDTRRRSRRAQPRRRRRVLRDPAHGPTRRLGAAVVHRGRRRARRRGAHPAGRPGHGHAHQLAPARPAPPQGRPHAGRRAPAPLGCVVRAAPGRRRRPRP